MLQCVVAVFHSVLQCVVAVFYSALQCASDILLQCDRAPKEHVGVAVCCSAVAVCCYVLQCVTVCLEYFPPMQRSGEEDIFHFSHSSFPSPNKWHAFFDQTRTLKSTQFALLCGV